jgi:hypothetical protein
MSLSQVRVFAVAWFACLVVGGLDHARAEPQPAPVPPEAAVPREKIHGLRAAYHDFGKRRPPGVPGIDSMQIARDFVERTPADVTTALNLPHADFPAGETGTVPAQGKSLRDFLLPADAGPASPDLDRKMSSRNIFVFTGFIEVKKPGVYDLRVRCDDAAEVTIGDVVVHSVESGGMYGPYHEPYLAKVEFSKPGLYPVEVLFWDKAGDAGLEIYSTLDETGMAREFGPGKELHLLPFVVADP